MSDNVHASLGCGIRVDDQHRIGLRRDTMTRLGTVLPQYVGLVGDYTREVPRANTHCGRTVSPSGPYTAPPAQRSGRNGGDIDDA